MINSDIKCSINCYHNCLARNPERRDAAEAWARLSFIYSATSAKDLEQAMNCAENAVKLGPNFYEAWYALVKANYKRKEYLEARAACAHFHF